MKCEWLQPGILFLKLFWLIESKWHYIVYYLFGSTVGIYVSYTLFFLYDLLNIVGLYVSYTLFFLYDLLNACTVLWVRKYDKTLNF